MNTNEGKRLRSGLAKQLVQLGSIITTLAKAKSVQAMVEKLMTKSKKGKGGGYTRIVKLGTRLGDGAQLVKFSLIEKEKPKEMVKKPYAKKHKINKSK